MNNTKIERKIRRKTNPFLVKTLITVKKKKAWQPIAHLSSLPRKQRIEKNLDEIDAASKEGDIIVVPGKVLGSGTVQKKIRVCALSFSKSAVKKLADKKCGICSLEEEIASNPKLAGVKVLK